MVARMSTPLMNYPIPCLSLSLLLAACGEPAGSDVEPSAQVGTIGNDAVREASGLARSKHEPGRLWLINDSGSATAIHAIGMDGSDQGSVIVEGARNVDWEDLAAFETGGEPQLLIADIGDNTSSRDHVSLHIVAEPVSRASTAAHRTISFRYPDGPRDAEAVAVDSNTAYVLSKRTIPAGLYSVPIDGRDEGILTAEFLGTLESLPGPGESPLPWHWQPTAMDFDAKRGLATILTYEAVYVYQRQPGGGWLDTLNSEPRVIALDGLLGAESVALVDGAVIVTTEGQDAPILRYEIGETRTVSIMTFNVENLFDNVDDPGKADETYLALEDKLSEAHVDGCNTIRVERWRDQCLNWDWSDAVIGRKLDVLGTAIRQDDDGRGPDVIAFQEVENLAILDRLRRERLDGLGYRTPILIEGDDARGIDVAFLSKLDLAEEPVLHEIAFDGIDAERVADTRGILEATFVLPDGQLLTGYAVHFPAPFHPTIMREMAYDRLNELRASLPEGRAAFAAGDFNTTSSEDRDEKILDRFARPHWTVAHDLCSGDCRGTSYYPPSDEWSFLDMILWSSSAGRGGNATWDLRAESVSIANHTPAQVRADGTPARFELDSDGGVSDHWPLVITLESK